MFIAKELYGHILEVMPILCVDVLILHKGKCLLLLRDNEPAKDTYWFPGGRVHKMETIAEAVTRKGREETALQCTFERIISVEETMFSREVNMVTDIHTVNVCCLASVVESEAIKVDRLHKGAVWIEHIDPLYHDGVKNPLRLIGLK